MIYTLKWMKYLDGHMNKNLRKHMILHDVGVTYHGTRSRGLEDTTIQVKKKC